MAAETKLVNFEVKNAKYTATGSETGTLIPMEGLKSLNLSPNAGEFIVRADGRAYYTLSNIKDVSVELVFVKFTDEFMTAHAGVNTTTLGGISEHIGTYANKPFDLVVDLNTSQGIYKMVIRNIVITGSVQREYKGDYDSIQDSPETYAGIAAGTSPEAGGDPVWKEIYPAESEGFTMLETAVFKPGSGPIGG